MFSQSRSINTCKIYRHNCVPDYLRRWSGRPDHNQITMRLLIVYTHLKCLAQSECGQDQDKGRMLEPVINGAPVSLTLPLSPTLSLHLGSTTTDYQVQGRSAEMSKRSKTVYNDNPWSELKELQLTSGQIYLDPSAKTHLAADRLTYSLVCQIQIVLVTAKASASK